MKAQNSSGDKSTKGLQKYKTVIIQDRNLRVYIQKKDRIIVIKYVILCCNLLLGSREHNLSVLVNKTVYAPKK